MVETWARMLSILCLLFNLRHTMESSGFSTGLSERTMESSDFSTGLSEHTMESSVFQQD
jgi:hypothetical protein